MDILLLIYSNNKEIKMAEKKFEEIFHHTQPMGFYDDLNSQSYQLTNKTDNDQIPEKVAPPVPVGRPGSQIYGSAIIPKSYDGKTNPRIWLNHYETVAEANLWPADIKLKRVIGSLDGAAQSWYMNQRLSRSFVNWNQFKDALISRFTNTLDDIMLTVNIIRTKQKNNDFDLYWEQKVGLIRLTSPNMSEKELMHHLFTGLNKDLKAKVMDKLTVRKCENAAELQALVKEIIDIENYQKDEMTSKSFGKNNYHSNAKIEAESHYENQLQEYKRNNVKIGKLEKELKKLKEILIGSNVNLDQINEAEESEENTEVRNWKDLVECFKCHEKGHFARDCNESQKVSNRTENNGDK